MFSNRKYHILLFHSIIILYCCNFYVTNQSEELLLENNATSCFFNPLHSLVPTSSKTPEQVIFEKINHVEKVNKKKRFDTSVIKEKNTTSNKPFKSTKINAVRQSNISKQLNRKCEYDISILRNKQLKNNKQRKEKCHNAIVYQIPIEFKNFNHHRFLELITYMVSFNFDDYDINLKTHEKQNINTYINLITNFFCIKNENENKFNVKKEFIIFQFLIPEFMPFIYFINNNKIYEKNIVNSPELFYNKFIQIFKNMIFTCKSITEVLDDMKNEKSLFLGLSHDGRNRHKCIFSTYILRIKNIIADYILLLYKDDTLLLSYDLLIRCSKKKLNRAGDHGLNMGKIFFVYFIVIFNTKDNKFMNKLSKHISIYNNKINPIKNSNKAKVIDKPATTTNYHLYNLKTFLSNMLELKKWYDEFNNCTIFFNLDKIPNLSCLEGFVNFDEISSYGSYILFDYKIVNKKLTWNKKIQTLHLIELCYLQLNKAIFYQNN